MNSYLVIITLIGLATFGLAWMPRISKRTGISYSVFYLLAGVLAYTLIPEYLPNPMPQQNETLSLHLSELVVIISLMGTGIKINRVFSLKKWAAPLKLVSITMLLCIAACALLGYYFLGLGLASAVLLGAVLAPTDPVLASDVQVGPPDESDKSESHFTLTSEAGLNDGVAFPFTWLAITLGLMATGGDANLVDWFTFDLLYRIAAGVTVGYLAGKGIGYLVFKMTKRADGPQIKDGFLAISLTLLVYGASELIHAYGFIAVFVCAFTFRHYEKGNTYHKELHSFTDQIERLLVCVLLMLFGGCIVTGILQPLNWKMTVFVLLLLVLIRPLFSMLSLITTVCPTKEKLAISFFGIRGMGSIFYLAFAFSEFDFDYQDELWAIVSLTILISVILHGFTATSIMRKIKKDGSDRKLKE